ncbi:unnamed protein product [Lymnaea stagnalis]|uniref:Pikachurin n=1 Tax=Lymnaea stagnalis TaxID=6523 RepID=A0AAV2HLU0_LYMST
MASKLCYIYFITFCYWFLIVSLFNTSNNQMTVSATERGKVVAFFQTSCASAAPNPCQQVCTDIRSGGFYCECRAGFDINADGMTCVETNPPPRDAILPGSTKYNSDGEVVVSDYDVVQVKSIDLTKGLPPLVASAHTRRLKTESSLVLDRAVYNLPLGGSDMTGFNVPEGGADNQYDVDLEIPEGGDYDPDNRLQNPLQGGAVSCNGVVCENNGTCAIVDSKIACQCPLGTFGVYCQKEIEVTYPKFFGNGYLALPVLRNAHKEFHVSLQFRPESPDGLLLFSGESSDAKNDFFSIVLDAGYVFFRFDCGTGHAELKSVSKVIIGGWNRVVITRLDNKGTLQLNDDHQIEDFSQGDYTRITFRLNLYMGGYSTMSAIAGRISTSHQFIGCVQELLINGRRVDFRKRGLVGESEFGVNVGECSANVCDGVVCQNGGTCTAKAADQHVCLCPLGFYGDTCTKNSAVHVPHFSGYSYLEFPGLQRSVLSYTEIEIVFKPISQDGTLFYNGFSRDRSGDFISLSLQDGHLEFRFDLGTGPAVIRSTEPLATNVWHLVRASRTGLMGTLHIDGQPQISGQAEGAYTQLTLLDGLYLGGHPNFDHTSKHANATRSFTGCLQKVSINKKTLSLIGGAVKGVNVSPCSHPCAGRPCMNGGECKPILDSYTCYCPIGYSNTNCEDAQDQLPTTPMFNGESYLMYKYSNVIKRVSGDKIDLQLYIRPTGRNGLLFWSGEDLSKKSTGDYFALGFVSGMLQLRYNLGSGEALLIYNDTRLFDGEWHRIRIQRDKQDAYMEIDRKEVVEGSSAGEYVSLNTDKTVYLGGLPAVSEKTGGRFTSGFAGCVSGMRLATEYDVKLIGQAHMGRNVGQCHKPPVKDLNSLR